MKKLLLSHFLFLIPYFLFSQNVGIGTLTPQAKLHVYAGPSGIQPFFTARLVVESNDHTYINLLSPDPFETGILFGSGNIAASGLISYNSSGTLKGFQFNNNGNQTRMVINSAGNVGIGTTSPQKNLSVQNGMNVDQADGNTGSTINAITFGNGSGEGIGSKRNAGGNQWGLDFYTNSTNKMSITNSGNVGIGTTTPAARLQVSAGNASFALFGPNSFGGQLYVGAGVNQNLASTAQVFASDGNLHIDPAAGKNIYLGYFQSRDIYLDPNGGKVGIGTSAPAATLEVNGYTKLGSDAPSIKVKKLTGTTNGYMNSLIYFPTGVDGTKIISVTAMVQDANGLWHNANEAGSGYNFFLLLNGNGVEVWNAYNDSANILIKPVKIMVTYEE